MRSVLWSGTQNRSSAGKNRPSSDWKANALLWKSDTRVIDLLATRFAGGVEVSLETFTDHVVAIKRFLHTALCVVHQSD